MALEYRGAPPGHRSRCNLHTACDPHSMLFRRMLIVVAILALTGCRQVGKTTAFSQSDFRDLLAKLALGLNTGNARLAAGCFTEDALYSAPPDPLIRKGRQQLFEFFGGQKGRSQPMSLLWHHVVFDPATGIGMGEYTFTYQIRTHDMVIVRIVGGKIANWREYERESPQNWEQMIGENRF